MSNHNSSQHDSGIQQKLVLQCQYATWATLGMRYAPATVQHTQQPAASTQTYSHGAQSTLRPPGMLRQASASAAPNTIHTCPACTARAMQHGHITATDRCLGTSPGQPSTRDAALLATRCSFCTGGPWPPGPLGPLLLGPGCWPSPRFGSYQVLVQGAPDGLLATLPAGPLTHPGPGPGLPPGQAHAR